MADNEKLQSDPGTPQKPNDPKKPKKQKAEKYSIEKYGLFPKRRSGVRLTKEEVREIKEGRKKLRAELRKIGEKSRKEFEITASSLGLYFDKNKFWSLLHWFFATKAGWIMLAAAAALLLALYAISVITQLRGHFTVSMSDKMFKEGFTISEEETFKIPTSHLFSTPAVDVPCISIVDIPEDVDYDGMEIGIAVRPQTQYRREFGSEVQSDPVDQRIFKRNEEVEKELGIKLRIMGVDQLWTIEGITEYVTTEYQSGVNSAVDVIAAYGAYGVTSGLRGYYINLLGDNMTYLNAEKLYWTQSYVEAATCYGQLYYIVGDVNLTVYDKSIVTFVNMDLAATNGISPETLYDAVDNKEWTYDYFYNICNGFTYLDTGNIENVVDAGDVIPLSSIGAEFVEGIPCAWELDFMVTHEDGSHSFNIDGNAKLEQALSMWSEIHSMHGVFVTSTVGENFTNNFIPGNGLFSIDILYRNADSNAMLRNADFTYAILPLPMYDTNQGGYYTTPQDA